MPEPRRGEIWIVDLGLAVKVSGEARRWSSVCGVKSKPHPARQLMIFGESTSKRCRTARRRIGTGTLPTRPVVGVVEIGGARRRLQRSLFQFVSGGDKQLGEILQRGVAEAEDLRWLIPPCVACYLQSRPVGVDARGSIERMTPL